MRMKITFLAIVAIAVLVPIAGFAADGTVTIDGTITPGTCVITPPGVVNLGRVGTTQFTGVGSTTAWSVDNNFTIRADCRGTIAHLYMVLTDASDPGNATSTLTLTAGSTADGVGIEIWRSSNEGGLGALHFGPDSSVARALSQFHLGDSDGGADAQYSFVFSTRYIQTKAVITPGTANSLATFTMSYQ